MFDSRRSVVDTAVVKQYKKLKTRVKLIVTVTENGFPERIRDYYWRGASFTQLILATDTPDAGHPVELPLGDTFGGER